MSEPSSPFDDNVVLDLDVLREMADNNEEEFQQLKTIYFSQTAANLTLLEQAVRSRTAKDIGRLAHSVLGSSQCFGAVAIVRPLRDMESVAQTGELSNVEALFSVVLQEFDRLKKLVPQTLA